MPSGPQSGKHAVVAAAGGAVEAVRNWILNDTSTPEDQVHSASLGGHNRLEGFEDWNGSCEGFGANPPFFPGEFVDLTLFLGPDTGVYGTAGLAHLGNVIIDSITFNWSWTPGGSLGWSAAFSANGGLAQNATADFIDIPSECQTRMCDLSIMSTIACTADNYVAFPKVQSASLTITADNQPVTNSSTVCQTFRRPGNIDWMLDIVDTENHILLTKGLNYKFKLFSTESLFWLVAFGHFQGITNVNSNVETGEIINKTNSFAMSGHVCCATVPTVGSIVTPTPVTKWPQAAV